VISNLNINIFPLPDGVRVRDMGAYRIFTNYNDSPVDIEGRTLKAAGIRLIDTKTNSTLIEN